mgnify:CR=1 FL=1
MVLDLIRLTGTPCVNPAATLQRGFDRLSMRAEMQAIGLPLLPQDIVLGGALLDHTEVTTPTVLKVGNYHAGYGKALVATPDAWASKASSPRSRRRRTNPAARSPGRR